MLIFPIIMPSEPSRRYHSSEKYRYSEKLVTSEYFEDVIVTFKLKDNVKPKGFWSKLFFRKPDIVRLGFNINKDYLHRLNDVIVKERLKDKLICAKVIDGDRNFLWSSDTYATNELVQDVIDNYEFVSFKDAGSTSYWERDYSRRDVYE